MRGHARLLEVLVGIAVGGAVGCSGPKYIGADDAVCSADRAVDQACGDDPIDKSLCLSGGCVPSLYSASKRSTTWALEIIPADAPSPSDPDAPRPAMTQFAAVTFDQNPVSLRTAMTMRVPITFTFDNPAIELAKASFLLTVPAGIPGRPDLSFAGDGATLRGLSLPDEIAGRTGTLRLSPHSPDASWPPYVTTVSVPSGGTDPLTPIFGGTTSVRGTLRDALEKPVPMNSFVARVFQGGALISNSAPVDAQGRYTLQVSDAAASAGPVQIAFIPKSNSTTSSHPSFLSTPGPLPTTNFDVTLPAYTTQPDLFWLPLQTFADPTLVEGIPVRATLNLSPSPNGTTTYSWDAVAGADLRAPLSLMPGTATAARRYTVMITPPVDSPLATTCQYVDVLSEGLLRPVPLDPRPVVSGTVSNATGRKVPNVIVTATWLRPLEDVPAPPKCIAAPRHRTANTTTDLEGKFELKLDLGVYRFDYDPPLGAPVPRETEAAVTVKGDSIGRDVKLGPAAYVEGTIHNVATGEGVPLAIVRLYQLGCDLDTDCSRPDVPPPELRAQAQTDGEGRFIAVVRQ